MLREKWVKSEITQCWTLMNCDERRKIRKIFYTTDILMSKLGRKVRLSMYDMVKYSHAASFFTPLLLKAIPKSKSIII